MQEILSNQIFIWNKLLNFIIHKYKRIKNILYTSSLLINNNCRLDDNTRSQSTLDNKIEKEYGHDKFEELKSNPKLKAYFKEMFINRNRAYRAKSQK